MSTVIRINVTVNKKEATKKIQDAEQEAKEAAVAIARTMRRSIQLGVLTMHALTGAVDEGFRVQAMLLGQAIETILTIRAVGFTPAVAVQMAQIAIMAIQISKIKEGQAEAAGRLSSAREGLAYLTF